MCAESSRNILWRSLNVSSASRQQSHVCAWMNTGTNHQCMRKRKRISPCFALCKCFITMCLCVVICIHMRVCVCAYVFVCVLCIWERVCVRVCAYVRACSVCELHACIEFADEYYLTCITIFRRLQQTKYSLVLLFFLVFPFFLQKCFHCFWSYGRVSGFVEKNPV